MQSSAESVKSELREHRHKFVFRFLGELKSANSNTMQEVLKRQYQKYYMKGPANRPISPTATDTNLFAVSTQRFFTTHRHGIMHSPNESRDFSSSMGATHGFPRKNQPCDELISITPADLSLTDLPSPRVSYDAKPRPNNGDARKTKAAFFKCPAVVSYINKKMKVK